MHSRLGESRKGILRSFPRAGPLVRIYGAIMFYLEHKEKNRGVPERSRPALGGNVAGSGEVQRATGKPAARSQRALLSRATLKVRFLIDANFNQKIITGLLIREAATDSSCLRP